MIYSAHLSETCSNGYAYWVEGKTLTEVRKKAIAKFKNGRWHKTADPPVCTIKEKDGTLYGKHVGRINIQKWYNSPLPYLFIWEPETNRPVFDERRLIKDNGELGMTYGVFVRNRNRYGSRLKDY